MQDNQENKIRLLKAWQYINRKRRPSWPMLKNHFLYFKFLIKDIEYLRSQRNLLGLNWGQSRKKNTNCKKIFFASSTFSCFDRTRFVFASRGKKEARTIFFFLSEANIDDVCQKLNQLLLAQARRLQRQMHLKIRFLLNTIESISISLSRMKQHVSLKCGQRLQQSSRAHASKQRGCGFKSRRVLGFFLLYPISSASLIMEVQHY